MTSNNYLVKATLKAHDINKRDKSIADPSIYLPASIDEIIRVLREADRNVLLENLTTEITWLNEEDECFNILDTYGTAMDIIFLLNEFCKHLAEFNTEQKCKLHGAIMAFSGITGPDGIGPWNPNLIYGINLAFIVDTFKYIGGITNRYELGEHVIQNKLLSAIENIDNEFLALLNREEVASKFMDSLRENGGLGNYNFVNQGKSNNLHGFFYNMPYLKDIPQTYDNRLPMLAYEQKTPDINNQSEKSVTILVADSCCDGWGYKFITVESESEFEYRVLKLKTREAMINYVGTYNWDFSKDVEGLIDAAYERAQNKPGIPCYLFSSSDGNTSFAKIFKCAELFSVSSYIDDNDRIAHYTSS